MQSSAAEYLDDPQATPPEKTSPFKLAPPDKDPGKLAPWLRRQCCRTLDGNPKLTSFDKLLFCRLVDMAFEADFKRGDGVLECSKKYLADDFGKSESTITRAARRLESKGFIWTQARWNGAFEMTWWFLREWADEKKEFPAHTGQNFGRRRRGVQRNTVRDGRGKFVPNPTSLRSQLRALMLAHGLQAEAVKAGLLPDHGQKSSLTTGNGAPGQGASTPPVHGQQSSLTGGSSAPGQGARKHPDREHARSRTGSTGAPGHGAKVTGQSTLKDTGKAGRGSDPITSTRVRGVTRARGADEETRREAGKALVTLAAETLAAKPPEPVNRKEFLQLVAASFGVAEVTRNGGLWTNIYREDAGYIIKCLMETRAVKSEGVIKLQPGSTWAAYCMDLYKKQRLGTRGAAR